jgi:SAM-dependent methyltransferase
MENVSCALCGCAENKPLFAKNSSTGESFTLVKCTGCGLKYVDPRPAEDEIAKYYESVYFTQRTDRGYNNYFSDEVRGSVMRTLAMNLKDLGFFEFEKTTGQGSSVLDIGCAAGYSVEYFRNRGWHSKGIDISTDCVDAARSRGLDVTRGSYLETEYPQKFDLITLWASIEHLHRPGAFLEKIHGDLKPGGLVYISTCRDSILSFSAAAGRGWRFYNFPEHLYFFSASSLKKLLRGKGFTPNRLFTYGSGFGAPGSMVRKAADFAAKKFYMGDMMIIAAEKK